MKKKLPFILALVVAVYPVVVYFGLENLPVRGLAVFFLVLFGLRLLLSQLPVAKEKTGAQVLGRITVPGAVCGLSMALLSLMFDSDRALLFYPVLVNATGLAVFGWSLLNPPSMIESIARLMDPHFADDAFPEEAVAYTRSVTWLWCGFFVVNGLIALWTAMSGDREVWLLYNGLLSYVAMGFLLGGEWMYRKWVLKV